MSNELINEINKYRSINHETSLDITKILENHITQMDSWEKISKFLIKNGFVCEEDKGNRNNSDLKEYICKYDLRKWYNFGFGDIVKIIIKTKSEIISNIKGEVIFQHL